MRCFILIGLLCLVFNYLKAHGYPQQETRRANRTIAKPKNVDTSCECGRDNRDRSSPQNGLEVGRNAYPWMASIISVNKTRVLCGATIINDYYVITAAHCLPYGFTSEDLKVGIGVHYACKWDETTTILAVEKIFVHPRYQSGNPRQYADVMLIKLLMKIFFNRNVRPICLPDLGENVIDLYGGFGAVTLGWGLSGNNSFGNGQCGLQRTILTLLKRRECRTEVKGLMCARHGNETLLSCGGDGGAPLQITKNIFKFMLIGITTGRFTCANSNELDFYTNVQEVLRWIYRITNRDGTYCRP